MKEKYQKISNIVNADLEKVNANLVFNIDLNPKVAKKIEKFIFAPSKRIRSLTAILYMRALGLYLLPAHYELLAAVEIMHNASLIHDDVIDEGKIRRDEKTFNVEYSNHTAVVLGDYLMSVALKKLVKIGSNEIFDIFADTLANMCTGEVNQYLSKYKIPSLDEYIEKSLLKTSSLFEAALKSSLLLCEYKFEDTESEFITNFGLAFQIRDDILNVLNKDKSKSSSDIAEGVYNAPMILDKNIDIGIEKTKDLLNNYVNCARQCIENLKESEYKQALYELLELIGNV